VTFDLLVLYKYPSLLTSYCTQISLAVVQLSVWWLGLYPHTFLMHGAWIWYGLWSWSRQHYGENSSVFSLTAVC